MNKIILIAFIFLILAQLACGQVSSSEKATQAAWTPIPGQQSTPNNIRAAGTKIVSQVRVCNIIDHKDIAELSYVSKSAPNCDTEIPRPWFMRHEWAGLFKHGKNKVCRVVQWVIDGEVDSIINGGCE
jgi:hypothetical protein